MERKEYCPTFRQSIKFLLMYSIVISVIVYLILGSCCRILKIDFNDPLIGSVSDIMGLGLILLWIHKKNKVNLKSMFLVKKEFINYIVPMILLMLGAYILLSEVDNLIQRVLPLTGFWEEILSSLMDNPYAVYKSVISVAIIAPIVEETVFRGILLRGFMKHYSIKKSVILSAVLFGIIHMNPWQFTGAVIFGMISGWWYVQTRSIVPCILAHMLNNGLGFILIYLLPFKIKGLTTVDAFQPIWFDLIGVILVIISGIWLFKQFKKHPSDVSHSFIQE